MPARPTSALVCSLAGGIVTLLSSIISINGWLALSSSVGSTFSFSSPGLGEVSSGEALILFAVGAVCGVVIMAGAVLQYSSEKQRVRRGSLLVLGATIIAAPATFFGLIFGGLLSVIGGGLGLSWKPPSQAPPSAPG